MDEVLLRYLTTEEVAEVFAVRPKTVRAWIELGELAAVKLHRRWRVPPAEVARVLEGGSDRRGVR